MILELEKLLKDSKVNLINCTINFITQEKKIDNDEETFLKNLSKEDAEKGIDELVKYIQKRIGFALPSKIIKEILHFETEFFINLSNQ